MKKIFVIILLIFSVLIFKKAFSQRLQPGFDSAEFAEIMTISARTGGPVHYYSDSAYIAEPQNFKLIYRSPEMGLLNLWELWLSPDNIAVITVRGTVPKAESWLSNFYAAMVPARGKLTLDTARVFEYELSSDPKAAVHVGWLMSTGFLAADILPKIDSCYQQGIKDFIITGHSQGGGISFLLTAHLLHLKAINRIPADVVFKTYSSAAPKPGNLYFAYDYELATQGGWAFNVVNRADWVPETPISIQTLNDFNEVNPFYGAKDIIKKQKFPKNLVLRFVYNKLEKPGKKAQRNYEKYLGKVLEKEIKKMVKGFNVDSYYHSSHYVRTGTTIILNPTLDYYKIYPQNSKSPWVHHFHHPYIFLINPQLLQNPEFIDAK